MIKSLSDNLERDVVGGKAYNLSLLLRNSFMIPEGYVLDTKAFQDFLKGYKEQEEFSFSDDVLSELSLIFDDFSSRGLLPLVARSSSINEDSNNLSYAGRLHTELNIHTFEHLLQGIQKCFLSLLSCDYQEYSSDFSSQTLTQNDSVAVIIQHMVKGEVGGVLFTADPVTNDFSLAIAEFAEGDVSNLVDGKVNCERVSYQKPRKCISTEYKENKLSKKSVNELFDLAQRIETLFKWPQDIEWTFKNNKFYVLQSRPITTLTTKIEQEDYFAC